MEASNKSSVSTINNPVDSTKSAGGNGLATTKPAFSAAPLNHSNKGDFTKISKKHISGGHGQDNIDFMDKNGIKYEINIVYSNGVRVGNIIDSADRKMRSGNNHSWFPKNWSESDIENAANNILAKKKVPKYGKVSGMHKNVQVTIILKNGEAKTMYPNKHQKDGKKDD